MDSRNYNINLNKRHLIQKYDKSTILIEFTIEQDIYDNEEYAGMNAYECYILDDENEQSIRGIYYYDFDGDNHFLKYYENYDDDTKKTITIYRILPMELNDTIEDTLAKSDEADNEDIGLFMGDIC
jgi:hypothetical protein